MLVPSDGGRSFPRVAGDGWQVAGDVRRVEGSGWRVAGGV